MRGRANGVDHLFKSSVNAHIDHIVKRAEVMACKIERESVSSDPFSLFQYFSDLLLSKAQTNNGVGATVPVVQTVTSLVSSATNPIQLAKMGELYQPWF